jgi:hypothetical protein
VAAPYLHWSTGSGYRYQRQVWSAAYRHGSLGFVFARSLPKSVSTVKLSHLWTSIRP